MTLNQGDWTLHSPVALTEGHEVKSHFPETRCMLSSDSPAIVPEPTTRAGTHAGTRAEPKVFELRTSRIRFVALPELIETTPPPTSLGARVARQAAYERELGRALQDAGELTVPWPPGSGLFHHFWSTYLGQAPDGITPPTGWQRFLPLRLGIPVRREAIAEAPPRLQVLIDKLPATLRLEAYAYPHGVALLSTAKVTGDFTLGEAVDAAVAVDDTTDLRLLTDGEKDKQIFKLPFLEQQILDRLVERMTGRRRPANGRDGFVVATVVRGEGAASEEPVTDEGTGGATGPAGVHRALEGLCTHHSNWRSVTGLPGLATRRLDSKAGDPADLLYAAPNARAVWVPRAQLDVDRRQTQMGCYHRNLGQLSLQMESLLGMIEMGAERLRSSNAIEDPLLKDMASRAVDLVVELYEGTTYRSSSAPRQVEEHDRKAAVGQLLAYFLREPLDA